MPNVPSCPQGNIILGWQQILGFPISYSPFFFALQWWWGSVCFFFLKNGRELYEIVLKNEIKKERKEGKERAKPSFFLSSLSFFKKCGYFPRRLLLSHHFQNCQMATCSYKRSWENAFLVWYATTLKNIRI